MKARELCKLLQVEDPELEVLFNAGWDGMLGITDVQISHNDHLDFLPKRYIELTGNSIP